jgi:D-3-phosphoglycerate dehydrogenase
VSKPIVLVTAATVSRLAQDRLRDGGTDLRFMQGDVTEDALISTLSAEPVAAILLRGSPPLTDRVFAAAPSLKIIAKHGAGVDSVDIAAATRRKIAVMVASGANADAVAEHAVMMMLMLSREVRRFQAQIAAGAWRDLNDLYTDFRDRTVGIIGYGQIGERTAKLAVALGAPVVVHGRSRLTLPGGMRHEPDLKALLTEADIVSLHCPLSPSTKGLIGAAELACMKANAFLINTARGPVVDEPALIEALQQGRIAGAGLDTFAVEPVDPANPLLTMPNVICTPHIAAATTGAALQMGTIASSNIIEFLAGRVFDPRNFLNPEILESGDR